MFLYGSPAKDVFYILKSFKNQKKDISWHVKIKEIKILRSINEALLENSKFIY